MTPEQMEIQAVAIVVAVACAVPGTFLVLRRMALMSDAISHAILVGIVGAFFLTHDLSSPWLILGASASGVLTVALVEALRRTGRVAEDAAIGLVFPALFAIGVIMVARFAGNVHLDVDSVLLGEIGFAPFNRWMLGDVDMGPEAFYVMGATLLLNVAMMLLFFKELKIGTFDAGLAASLGFAPVAIHYGLMTLVSVTAVGAFDAVGSILVVALMIAPPATAFLLTESLAWMVCLGGLIGACSAVAGYWLAFLLDASIAGSMATMSGVFFLGTLLLAPERGLLAVALRRHHQRWEFALGTLAVHLFQHEGLPEAEEECRLDHLQAHLNWSEDFAGGLLARGRNRELFTEVSGQLFLTEVGRNYARENMLR